MARFDTCPNCGKPMPTGNLHCSDCGAVLPPPVLDSGSVLVQLYAGITQTAAFEVYRTEVTRLAAAGWYPIAHSWGDERPGARSAATAGPSSGTLMVTYRQEGHA